jgi:hypothetical protein
MQFALKCFRIWDIWAYHCIVLKIQFPGVLHFRLVNSYRHFLGPFCLPIQSKLTAEVWRRGYYEPSGRRAVIHQLTRFKITGNLNLKPLNLFYRANLQILLRYVIYTETTTAHSWTFECDDGSFVSRHIDRVNVEKYVQAALSCL